MDIKSIGQKANLFVEIDKKITIKFLKEVKTSRTYICGLSDFMSDEKIKTFTKELKKNLGAGMIEKIVDNKKEFGFQGNHAKRIAEILLSKENIPQEKIKMPVS